MLIGNSTEKTTTISTMPSSVNVTNSGGTVFLSACTNKGGGSSSSAEYFGTYFVNQILPHVKSFAYTWFHLQAAKRKHFKNEDKRMNPLEEAKLKQKLENETASIKMKWAVRLLMKLRKDIQNVYQKELINVISSKNDSCVLSNPDMKGKMRRIDCLRQSDKVWRLDLVMVVLFKGIPLESSDGERLDKLPECNYPQLCINPNHALLNVRDLEVYLANYILNHQLINDMKEVPTLYHKNIASPSVFSAKEFLTLADVTILNGATDTDLKNSLNITSGTINNHYSDDNEDLETIILKEELDDDKKHFNSLNNENSENRKKLSSSQLTLVELEKMNFEDNKRPPPSDSIKNETLNMMPKKKKLKKQTHVENINTILNKTNVKLGQRRHEVWNSPQQNNASAATELGNNETSNEKSNINPVGVVVPLLNINEVEIKKTNLINLDKNEKKKSKKTGTIKIKNCESPVVGLPTSVVFNEVNKVKSLPGNTNLTDLIQTVRINTAPTINTTAAASIELNSTQQDEEIKELLMPKQRLSDFRINQLASSVVPKPNEIINDVTNEVKMLKTEQLDQENEIILKTKGLLVSNSFSPSSSTATMMNNKSKQSITDELKELIQKEKQNTADLFFQLLKCSQEDQCQQQQQLNTPNPSIHQNQSYMHQNSNSSDISIAELSSIHINSMNNQQNNLILQGQRKPGTPVNCVDQLLISPLFNQLLPSCGSTSSNSSNSSNSCSSTNANSNMPAISNTANNMMSFSQFSAASKTKCSKTNVNNRKTGVSNFVTNTSSTSGINGVDLINSANGTVNNKIMHTSRSSFKRTKHDHLKNSKYKNEITDNIALNKNTNNGYNNQSNKNHINASCINALRFDTNSNNSFIDELVTVNGLNEDYSSSQEKISFSSSNLLNTNTISKPNTTPTTHRTKTPTLRNNRANFIKQGSNTEESNSKNNQINNIDNEDNINLEIHNLDRRPTNTINTSPPPPPSIGTILNMNTQQPSSSSSTAPSPTKLQQFYNPYTSTSSGEHIMHRPIPILQKADAALSTLINNLTSSSTSLSTHIRQGSSPQNLNSELIKSSLKTSSKTHNNTMNSNKIQNSNQSNILTTNTTNSNKPTSQPSSDLSEFIKINNQQQLITSLRSSMSNNSPLMFNMGFNNAVTPTYMGSNSNGNNNNVSINNMNSFSNNGASNIFSNYANLSPANGMMMGGGGNNASPTSNLFPSITSLFQSPIGTPRVTPTPQHLAAAAYFSFNDDQFHSLIFNPNSSLSQNSNDLSNMITNFTNSGELNNNGLSPLPLFNNLIQMGNNNSNSNLGPNTSQSINSIMSLNQTNGKQESSGKVINTLETNSENSPLLTPKNNLLSANN